MVRTSIRIKTFGAGSTRIWRDFTSRKRRGSLPDQFLCLEDDHVFIQRLKHGILETRVAVEKTALAQIEQKKFEEGPSGQAIKEFFLVKAATVDLFAKEGLEETELLVGQSVLHNLLRL